MTMSQHSENNSYVLHKALSVVALLTEQTEETFSSVKFSTYQLQSKPLTNNKTVSHITATHMHAHPFSSHLYDQVSDFGPQAGAGNH